MITFAPQSLATIPAAVMSKTALAMIPPAPIPQIAGSLCSTISGAAFIRGGAEAAFDLTRQRIRIEGLSAYGVTTALLMNGALRLLSATPKKMQDVKEGGNTARLENVATVLFSIVCVTCILCAAYTTCIFSMTAMYEKTALGMGIDDRYMEFFRATEVYRRRGFNTYVTSLICFKSSLVLNLFLNYKGRTRWMVSGLAALIALVTWSHLSQIIHLATRLLYS